MSNESVKDHLLCAFLDEELSHDDVDSLLELLECDDVRARASRQSLAGSVMSNQRSLCVDISASVRQAVAQEEPLSQPVSRAPTASRRAARRWFSKQTLESSRAVRRRWQVPAAGVALAASVAVAAVVIVQPESASIEAAANQVAAAQPSPNGAALTVTTTPSEPLLAKAEQAQDSNLRARSSLVPRGAGAQLVSAGNNTPSRSTGRELVIAAPEQERPVSAQWALVSQQAPTQQVASQQRVREQLNTYLINHARHGGGAALTGSLGYARVAARPIQNTASE